VCVDERVCVCVDERAFVLDDLSLMYTMIHSFATTLTTIVG